EARAQVAIDERPEVDGVACTVERPGLTDASCEKGAIRLVVATVVRAQLDPQVAELDPVVVGGKGAAEGIGIRRSGGRAVAGQHDAHLELEPRLEQGGDVV